MARWTSVSKPMFEKAAVLFPATVWTTRWSPRVDEDVGDGLRQVLPDGQGEQVVLAALLGDRDEVALVEARRALEDRAGDLDALVEGEVADGPARRVGDVGKALGQLDARAKLDLVREADDDLVEHADMVFVELRRQFDEEARQAAQRIRASRILAAGDRVLDIPNQRAEGLHQRLPSCRICMRTLTKRFIAFVISIVGSVRRGRPPRRFGLQRRPSCV